MEKTNTSKSPLLKPVIERDYTKGININSDNGVASSSQPDPPPQQQTQQQQPGAASQSQPQPPPQQKFNMSPPPPDSTKEFSFDEIPEGASDINADDSLSGINISSASAKTFANFAGDAIQMYLPKATYGYSKIDIENVIVNIEKGYLTNNWLDAFNRINENTEAALQISDDAIKMWKKAFKDYLEANNIAFANPTTALILATMVLLADQGVKAYQIRKANEEYMRQALEKSSPGIFVKQPNQTEKTGNNGDQKAA
jgi:hypothetical protein